VFLLVPAYLGSPGPKAVKRLCVCACVCVLFTELDVAGRRRLVARPGGVTLGFALNLVLTVTYVLVFLPSVL